MTSPAATRTRRTNGPIVGNTDAPTRYYDLMSGWGAVDLKRLLSGPQLTSTLEIAEHVAFLDGASCGPHQHVRTEEFYYVLQGAGIVDMDGQQWKVHGGDLIITPLNSTHKIGAQDGTSVAILVAEVLPGPEGRRADPTRIAMPELLADQATSPADGVRIASVDLDKYFTGTWHPFQLAALEPGARLGPRTSPDAETFLYVAAGDVDFELAGRLVAGNAGLYAVVPPGMPWTIVNGSTKDHAEVVITQIGLP